MSLGLESAEDFQVESVEDCHPTSYIQLPSTVQAASATHQKEVRRPNSWYICVCVRQ